MIQTKTSQLQLMFMVSYYPMILVKVNKGDKIPLHALKNITEVMIILQTLMGLPPLPQGHTFVVTSILMQMLTARGLFSGLRSEDHMPI